MAIRHKVEFFLLFWLIVAGFATYNTGLSLHYTFLFATLLFLTIADFMFLGRNSFVYDPSYASWVATVTPSQYD